MTAKHMFVTEKQKEKVALIRLIFDDEDENIAAEDLRELARLVDTAGGTVLATITQKRHFPDPAFYLGKGKIEELAQLVAEQEIETIICDDELKSAHVKNISKVVGQDVKILDRSGLILDIFALHAKSPESRIQVQLAQLVYMLPRLTGMWKHLERQEGAIGTRGPGEKQIESDRRAILHQIAELKRKLREIEKDRLTQRKKRSSLFRVAIVGYTNAGKSSLLHALSSADVFIEDMLFATLDSTTRKLDDGKNSVLITDTVGFIKKLPHALVESFKSTLAEAQEANLLLIVADGSDNYLDEKLHVVFEVLKEIGAGENFATVINKIDLLSEEQLFELRRAHPTAHFVSAKTLTGIAALKDFIFGT